MKAWTIVAWTYDAGIYCVPCATKAYPGLVSGDDVEEIDSEGNTIHPVFASDEAWQDDTCGDCHQRIEDTL